MAGSHLEIAINDYVDVDKGLASDLGFAARSRVAPIERQQFRQTANYTER